MYFTFKDQLNFNFLFMKNYIILLGIAGAMLFQSCGHKKHNKHEEGKFLVTSPIQKDTTIYETYVCQIQAIQHIDLRALEKGYLQNIYVDEGQFVKKGQIMFQVLPLIYQAEMQKAQAEANFAEIEYQTTKNLSDSNIVSKNELALSKAKFDKAKAELDLAKVHLGFTEIRAPFDGIMGRFHVRLGSLLDEGELLTTLSDNSKMWVYFNVPEAEYLSYKINAAKEGKFPAVKLELANKVLFNQEGIIETIEADFNNETGNIAFRATFPNPDDILRHGETGNILMPIHYKNALIIPQKATFEVLDKKYVYVVNENNEVVSKEIKVGAEQSHIYIVIDGLSPNDKILYEGLRKVKNNQKISYDFIDLEEALEQLNELYAE